MLKQILFPSSVAPNSISSGLQTQEPRTPSRQRQHPTAPPRSGWSRYSLLSTGRSTTRTTSSWKDTQRLRQAGKRRQNSGNEDGIVAIANIFVANLYPILWESMNYEFMERHAKAAPSWQEASELLGNKDIASLSNHHKRRNIRRRCPLSNLVSSRVCLIL